MKLRNKLFVTILLIFSFNGAANAAQFIDVSDGIEVTASISLREINRIRVEGGKIDGIRVSQGLVEYSRDDKSGDIFINLSKKNKRPINIFITSDSGATFKLLLQPKDIPSEQIFLVERTAKNGLQVIENYSDQLIEFYKSLYTGIAPKDYKIVEEKDSTKIGDIKVTLKSSYVSIKPGSFRGDIYEIKNKSKKTQFLNPQDFYRDGIRAIKFDSYILAPKEITTMYIISIAG